MPNPKRELLNAFAKRIGRSIDCFPDEINRNSMEVDAIAGDVAIEHTTIYALDCQKEQDAVYRRLLLPIESFFRDIDCRIEAVYSFGSLGKGFNYDEWQAEFGRQLWQLIESARGGQIEISGICITVPDLDYSTQLKKGLFFRAAIRDSSSVGDRVNGHLISKFEKLNSYAAKRYRTLLLVESDDIQLMNDDIAAECVASEIDSLEHFHVEIWYADTSVPEQLRFNEITTCVREKSFGRLSLTTGTS